MPIESSLPSYEQLFGDLSFRATDESRSVYSPAAYLADLLEVVDTTFQVSPLTLRRPDIKDVPLDTEHTYTVLPYLDIVNEVLENRISEAPDEAYETLRNLRFPLNLPFSLRNERLKKYLNRFGVGADELYRAFATLPDGDVVARVYLGLSIEDVDAVTTPVSGQPERFGQLDDAERFRRATTLTAAEVRELLFGNLGISERSAAAAFFIHQGGPRVTLDENETTLLWGGGEPGIPEEWYDRVARFVRLARKIGMSLADLDLVLRSCCANRLDRAALRTVAAVVSLRRAFDLPVDVVCALAAPMNTLGLGDEDRPRHLFDRVFDTPPTCSGDILAERNKAYRQWITRVLGLAETDIVAVVTRFRARKAPGPFDRGEIGLADLSLLHRISCLTSALDIPVAELFGVLDALESDPSILSYPLPIDTVPQGADCYRMLDAADPGSSLWLTQLLVAVVGWMQAHSFGAEELIQILGGAAAQASEQDAAEQRDVLENLRQAFENVGLAPDLLVSRRFSERAAEAIHAELVTHADGVVSARDTRLLRVDKAVAETAAYHGIVRLAGITEDDFLGLGLDERLTAKIFANLVFTGYLESTGVLVESRLPAADLRLASDFGPYRDFLFSLIADRCTAEPASFFPSDLEELADLTAEARAELYDNLVFNFYLDLDGNVLAPDFFATPENAEGFAVNTHLNELAPAVLNRLRERVEQFRQEPITLDPTIFATLELTEPRLTDLLDSLRFNGYLDPDGRYADKTAMLGLDQADFGVALEFYPYRHSILDAMRAQLESTKEEWHTFVPEDFQDIADIATANRIAALLDGSYLIDDHVPEQLRPLLSDPSPELPLGEGFTPSELTLIFHRISVILREQQRYQLDFAALADLGFDPDESDQLVALLVEEGCLTDELTIARDRLGYFGNVHNALTFSVAGHEDFSKDVFFLLHRVAGELTAGIAEIVTVLIEQADQQRTALFTVLQDAFGIPGPTVEAICAAVAGGVDEAIDLLVAPVLAVDDTVTDVHFLLAYRRIRRFALLAAKLALDPAEVSVTFQDQDLAGKFPESLAFPPGVDRIDALLEDSDGTVYLFGDRGYWAYAPTTRTLVDEQPKPLTELSSRFAGLAGVDAAFTDATGTAWIIGHELYGVPRAFTKESGSHLWTRRDQIWGRIKNNFADPARIDTAFVDDEGRTYLFSGDQYVRYSGPDYTQVDEGYPRTLGEWREDEGPHVRLAVNFQFSLDAAFQGRDGKFHLFKEDRHLEVGSAERPIVEVWGRLRNTFDQASGIDAAYTDGSALFLFSGNQLVRYTDGIENGGVRVDDGSPLRIESHFGDVPAEFVGALDAALVDGAGIVHLFKDGKTVALTAGARTVEPTARRWGRLGPVLPSGAVDAAFVGLDGKTYLFSGSQYLRYSGADYAVVDAGYPRLIAGDWGGLRRVDAAFVLDNRTYLFGVSDVTTTTTAVTDGAETRCYVRYSTRNYTTPDTGYPKPLPDNWWNLPDWPAPNAPGFTTIDAVFTGRDNQTYLFSGQDFVVFDNKHRWWSEPRRLSEHWDSIPFGSVDAAFVGNDGKTYVFSGGRYIRYSSADYTAVDDRYPAPIGPFWGNVVNNIARTGKVDATLVIDSPERHTYLFSGNQYVRYTGTQYAEIDSGYPKKLASLKDEPRLGNLGVALERVDAAFADQRNVYLFAGKQCHVVSDALYRRYDLGVSDLGCVFVEDGSVLVEEPGGWLRYSALEGTSVTRTPVRPRTLRSVPPEFRDRLDAVLCGTDGNTYLFKGMSCFNKQLNRAYPLAEEWGRPRNNVYHDNRVDTAFTGRDGKTYVFSGDQFVVYSGSAYDGEIVGEPRSVRDSWAGLANVTLAYIQDGKTYLFEKPNRDGTIRYVVYSGTDYSNPDSVSPNSTDSSFWQIPDEYRPENFIAPDAVLFEGDTMLLLTGAECVQFNETTKQWSYPRPLDRVWRDFGRVADGDTITAAFTGLDGVTYFFFQDEFTRYQDRTLAPRQQIRDTWGRPRNEFAGRDGTGRIDAAVVAGGRTFLFSGTQYVRYSGPSYQWVDPGYPKPIAGNLRKEEMFAALPDSFEEILADRIAAGGPSVVDAIIANDRNVYLFVGRDCHVVSRALTATLDVGILGRVRNTIVDSKKIDAALVTDEHTLLFSGDQYVRYSGVDYAFVDDGYPRTLEASLPAELGIAALPEPFQNGIDAALRGADGQTYLFAGKQYLRADGTDPRPIAELWGRVRNEFAGGTNVIDAVFVAPTGELYAFRGGQYLRYRAGEFELAEEGYPRTIKDDWGDLPASFEAAITGAFSFEGRTYLVRDDEYVRYSGGRYHEIDRTYPQTFRQRWSNSGDYRLSDVHTIVRFVDLARSRPAGLADFLLTGADDPYRFLADLFGWDADELGWVKRNDGFLPAGNTQEFRFELEFLLKAAELFELAAKLGTGPSRIYTDIWSRIHSGQRFDAALDEANAALYELLERGRGADEWLAVSGEIHDELNLGKRDALVSAVTADPRQPGLVTSRDLFEQLLIDVEMGSEARTSKVREAIAAVQLYLHRYLLNLEPVTLEVGKDEGSTRRRLKRWWTWMRAYRIWEANRKVFLYPENYLRPELRGGKTPAFQQLEDDLLQGEITNDTVLRAYQRYLDEYTEVSRLAIAGGYVYPAEGIDEQARSLVLFGTTRTDPRRYYYRRAEILGGGGGLSTTWEPWLKVGVQIDADDVAPIHAFGRVFVFWAMADSTAPAGSTASIVAVKDGDTQHVSAESATNRIKICYSFCDLNGEWLPVQSHTVDSRLTGRVSELKVAVQARQSDYGGHEAIVVSCSYLNTSAGTETVTTQWTTRFALPPELYPIPLGESVATVTGAAVTGQRDALLRKEIFDTAPSNRIDEARVVTFNSTTGDGYWFSIDHRGGSFLFRPGALLTDEKIEPQSLKRNRDRLPQWDRIDAAVQLPDGATFFFQNEPTPRYLEVSRDGKRGRGVEPMSTRWQLSSVDAAYVVNDALYLISGKWLLRYTLLADGSVPEQVDPGYPRPLPHRVEAVFQRRDHLYLFSEGEYARMDPTGELDRSLLVWQRIEGNWGGLPVGFESGFDGVLDSDSALYLFVGAEYVRYDKLATVSRPYERASLPYDVVRLTTSTAHKLNEKLLDGGVEALLDPRTQEYDEVPAFSTKYSDETTIHVREERVDKARLPVSTHLDFDSANGIYYWEIFFHAPLLIAQALNGAQRFEVARQWYEYVFDPTETTNYWRFLPFLAIDLTALSDSCAGDLLALSQCDPSDATELGRVDLDATALHGLLDPLLAKVSGLAPAFQRHRPLDSELAADLMELSSSTAHTEIEQRMRNLSAALTDEARGVLNSLCEKAAIIAGLRRQYELLGDPDKLIKSYQDDPFDPHAIAEWRPVAYRRAVVMAYIDNLLDWGDMLFRQYLPESIDEARMLYILAYDLLGARPETLGTRLLPASRTYAGFDPESDELDPRTVLTGDGVLLEGEGEVHAGVANPYFTIPGNSVFADYWVRVEDRLRKIRLSQNILGISQPVPLFAPPIDPMALVEGTAAGVELSQLTAGMATPVPHYRFAFMFRQAQLLVDRVRQLGSELLSVLEKRDAEELNLLQNRQEGAILAMTRAIKDAQVRLAEENLEELKVGRVAANGRVAYYQKLVDEGLTPLETAQLVTMGIAGGAHLYASANKIGAAFAYGMPQALIGPFIMGTEMGGKQAGKVFDKASEIWQMLGESMTVIGELLGVRAAHERSMGEWNNELRAAKSSVVQIGHQVVGAEQQLAVAEREREILAQEISHKEAVATFLKDKFANARLYSWMSGRLSETYFQAYNLAYDLARAAERAFQFERGLGESEVSYIRPLYWESRHSGLLAAESLGIDLERLGKAYLDTGGRGLEITKQVSLLELDPVALLRMKSDGKCEIALTEALFDHDFPGHFRRQIRTVTVTFVDLEGARIGVNATMTQLGHKTVMVPDPKAVKHLLDPKGPVPGTIRADWRASQRITLSEVDDIAESNGLFELRYDDDRYLPFEGTGAVSTWRLEFGGRRPADLYDVIVTVKYTANAGDAVFTNAVKGMLKPYPAARFFDMANDFPQEWEEFLSNGDQELTLPMTSDLFPNMTSRQITGIYPKYELAGGGAARFVLDGDTKFTLNDGKLLATPGLSLSGNGDSQWTLRLDGEKQALTNLGLVLTYKASG